MDYLRAKFRDEKIELQMVADGFIYIPDFLSKEIVYKLRKLYDAHHNTTENGKGMWNSMYDVGKDVAANISSVILDTLKNDFDKLFESYMAPVASFMSKNPGEYGVCEFHRDFSILDEDCFEYRNVWIPLVDVSVTNGALYALKGSHKIFDYPLPMFQKWPYIYLQDKLFKHADIFSIKAGDLVVYADRTLHGSLLNKSNVSRPVLHLGVLHPESTIAYYYLSGNLVKVFEVPFEFYFNNDFTDLSGKYPLLKTFKYLPPSINEEDILNFIS